MHAKDIYISRSAVLLSQLFELAAKKIVCEHLATVVDSFLRSVDTSSLGNPNFWKTCWVEVAIKPLTPTSSVNSKGFQDELIAILFIRARDRYLAHDQSGCVFADKIRGMARVFGRHMLASDNCQRAPCTCHVAQGYCRQERVRTAVIWRKYVGTGVRSKKERVMAEKQPKSRSLKCMFY